MFHKVGNKEDIKDWVKALSLDSEKKYLITVKVFRKRRSVSQNNLLWAWMTALANHIGDSKESVHNDLVEALGDVSKDILHEAFKRKFLKWEEVELPGGLSYYAPGHTPEQDTQEFSDYMNKIHLHSFEYFGYFLPYPGDEGFEEFMETYNVVK